MNDIDHEPTERAGWETKIVCSCGERCSNWMQFYRHRGDSYRDAIETGRQWATLARRYRRGHFPSCRCPACTAFRDVADRTPTPTDGA